MTVCVLGSINLDIVANVESLPAAGETVIARGVEHFPGGKGANQAAAAVRMGADTVMLGMIGDDEAGQQLRSFLQDSGVDVAGVVVRPDTLTGQAFINVAASGQNAIVVASGANGEFGPEHIVRDCLRGRSVFLAQLETPLAAIEALFSTDVATGGTRILNATPADSAAAALFPLIDILVVNEVELAQFAGLAEVPQAIDDVIAGARTLLVDDNRTVVTTLGEQGAVAVNGADNGADNVVVAGRSVSAVDTTGAGDCFCGALAAALGRGQPMPEALQFANVAASISVQRPGAAASMPTLAEVEALLGA